MKYQPTFLLPLLLIIACQNEKNEHMKNPTIPVEYPNTEKKEHTDTYGDNAVRDDYHWLEDDRAPEVEDWVVHQNQTTRGYLDKIPFRQAIEDRYRELYDYPKLSSPYRVGDYYFFYKNDGLQNQSVIYVQHGLDGDPEVFIDPNTLSKNGTVAISLAGSSSDDRYLSYLRQEAGSDWAEVHVMEIATRQELPDVIEHVKFSGTTWYKTGFYYCRFPDPDENEKFSAANQYHSVYYHQLGKGQDQDELIYRDEANPNYTMGIDITEDEQYLILTKSSGTDGFETWYRPAEAKSAFIPLFTGFAHKNSVVDHDQDAFLVHTDIDAPKYRLIRVEIKQPEPENWQVIIPESDDLLQGVSSAGGKLFADYLKDVTTRMFQFEKDGSGKKEIQLPGLGSAGGFHGKKDYQELFYTYTSFLYPPTIFLYDIASGASKPFFETPLKYNPDEYTEEQVFYTSKDGTRVPMFLVHKKGLALNGQNPAFLYGYGGFNISLSPYFSPMRILILENDGVFALANLRGGGEYGEEWHRAGMLEKKQNVFDDFIAAAEFLIDTGFTSKDKLAISGGSNGGLLVGAAMTQRPDLFAVAFPAVGVLDMLRYQKFTIGHAWAVEYGSSDDPEQYQYLKAYSPLHNLKDGVHYPATLVTTGDHDDRVVPAHSFKFAARLQEAHLGENPVLIRIETDAGHGAGKPTGKIIEEGADVLSFFFYNTNSPVKYLKG